MVAGSGVPGRDAGRRQRRQRRRGRHGPDMGSGLPAGEPAATGRSGVREGRQARPDQAVGYADLGLVYLREGRYREAEAQLRRAAALDSADGNIGLMLAKVYELSGREAETRREIERVLRRDSTDIRALYAAGELAGRSADPGERRRHEGYLRLVVARAPANLAARLELVDLLLTRGAADDAAAQLEALQRE